MKGAVVIVVVVLLALVVGSAGAEVPGELAQAEAEFKVTVKSEHGGGLIVGETKITVDAPAEVHGNEWDASLVVKAHGKTVVPFQRETEGFYAWATYHWTCRHYDLVYTYTATATSPDGKTTLTRTGHFKGASRWWCKVGLAQKEGHDYAKTLGELHQQEAKERAERERHDREAREHRERYETNCRKIGGIPVTISTSSGPRIVCHSKTGGVIPVPT